MTWRSPWSWRAGCGTAQHSWEASYPTLGMTIGGTVATGWGMRNRSVMSSCVKLQKLLIEHGLKNSAFLDYCSAFSRHGADECYGSSFQILLNGILVAWE